MISADHLILFLVSSLSRYLEHTQRRATVGRAPLDEWSARRRDLHLTTHNTRNRQTSMPSVGFEPTISAGERPKTARPLGPGITQYCSGGKIEKNEMGGASSAYGKLKGVYRVLVRKTEGKRPLGRPRRRWKDNIKMDLQEVRCVGMDWI